MMGKTKERNSPKLVADAVILAKDGKIILVKRKFEPFAGFYAIPGGFVECGETAEAACVREAWEETGLRVKIIRLLGVYSDPKRDPRFHTASVVYLCSPAGGRLKESTDETEGVKAFAKSGIRKMTLAFDHRKILKDAGLI
jgi:8-oxo-dGTP diphosphatase